MAFISEINFKTGLASAAEPEFLEVVLGPGDDPADFVVSFYGADANLSGSGVMASGVSNGEVTLDNAAISSVPDPDNPNYTIYTIESTSSASTLFNGVNSASAAEASHVALTNTSTGEVLDAYSVQNVTPTTLSGGAADGTSTESAMAGTGDSIKFDYQGNNVSTNPSAIDGGDAIVPPVVCFTRGMMIEVECGEKAVEDLEIGDLVRTLDNGYQPIRFIYKREVLAVGEHAPIIFEPGAIGNTKQFVVSQRHRIHTSCLKFIDGSKNYLIEAIELLNNSTIRISNTHKTVEYFHLMFDKHELLFSSGTISESWQPHRRNLRRDKALREELLAIFPEIAMKGSSVNPTPVRKTAKLFGNSKRLRSLGY